MVYAKSKRQIKDHVWCDKCEYTINSKRILVNHDEKVHMKLSYIISGKNIEGYVPCPQCGTDDKESDSLKHLKHNKHTDPYVMNE